MRIIPQNPFEDLKAPAQVNTGRKRFVTREIIERILEAAPDFQWRLISPFPAKRRTTNRQRIKKPRFRRGLLPLARACMLREHPLGESNSCFRTENPTS